MSFSLFDPPARGSSKLKCGAGFFALGLAVAAGTDWAQFRGPTHDGVSSERINLNWQGSATNAVWLVPVPASLCSLAVSGGRVFTQVNRVFEGANTEVCLGLSALDGSELWAAPIDDANYPDGGVGYDDGPRTTPATDGGSVYVLSSYLKLYRLNATNGAVIWMTNLVTGLGASPIRYQNAASPVLENGLLFLNANCGTNTLMAISTTNGSVVWRSQNEKMTHSTPVVTSIAGVRQVIFATQSGLVSVNAQTGSLLWKFAYPFTFNSLYSLAASPVVYQDMVFVTGNYAYGYGSVARRVTFTNNAWSTTLLWSLNNPAAHFSTPVVYQGFLYGQFGIQSSYDSPNAQLKCIDMRTGSVKWSTNGFGRGNPLLVNGRLLVLTETGQAVLALATTNAYTELGRFQAIPDYDGDTNKCWNSPALADGHLYVRSSSYAACFDFSVPALKLDLPQPAGPNQFSLTVRAADGSSIDSNRLAAMELRSGTNLALAPAAWTKLTNMLVLTNGTVRLTNVDARQPSQYFIVSEPK